MKNLDKVIHLKLAEICFLFIVIVVSFPLWKTLEKNEMLSTAATYADAQFTYVEVENLPNNSIYPVTNEWASMNIKPTTIKVINDTRTEEDYVLALSIEKNSTLDYHCLNISFDNVIKPLENLLTSEDEEKYYFTLATDSIQGEIKGYYFKMWMDEQTGNEMQGKTLSYNFELQKQIAI